MCKICPICTILKKWSKTLFYRRFWQNALNACKTAVFPFSSKNCKSSPFYKITTQQWKTMYFTPFSKFQPLIHANPTKKSVNIRITAFCTRFLSKCKNLRKQGIWRLFCSFPKNVQNMHDWHNNEKMCENAVLEAILGKCLKCVQNGCFSFFLKQLQIITI